MKKAIFYLIVVVGIILLIFGGGTKKNDSLNEQLALDVNKDNTKIDYEKTDSNSILTTIFNKDKKVNSTKLNPNIVSWDKDLSLIKIYERNEEVLNDLINICDEIGIDSFEIYNENESSYPSENILKYVRDEKKYNEFSQIEYSFRTINNSNYNFKLSTKFDIEKGSINNNEFDFKNMPQYKFFVALTGINNRDFTSLNESINKFLSSETSEFSRIEYTNDFNGLEETIVVRPHKIYYYLKTKTMNISQEK